jgi:hypothetical protein
MAMIRHEAVSINGKTMAAKLIAHHANQQLN